MLDLEGLASHRASVLGVIPGQPQPSQKQFEMRVWQALRQLDATRPVYVEAESKKVGNVTLPESLIAAMRASPCLRVDLSEDERVGLLLEDYPFFVSDPAFFCQRLDTLGGAARQGVIDEWKALVHAGQTETVVRALLALHYDPGYASSTRRNFVQFDRAEPVVLADRSRAELARAAQAIVQGTPGAAAS